MSKPDANEQLKQLIRDEIKLAQPSAKSVFAPRYTKVLQRGFHYFAVPKGAHQAHVILIGGGGGSGGAGSGGVANSESLSGGGGGGGGGGGDGEVFPHPDHIVTGDSYLIDLSNYQPLELPDGTMLQRHVGMYVGRGGDGGDGGKAVAGAASAGVTGLNGADGVVGRPTYIFGLPQGSDPNHSDGYLIAPSQVAALAEYATYGHTTTSFSIGPQSSTGQTHSVFFAYAHGGFAGLKGYGGSIDAENTTVGQGGAGGAGFYAVSAGGAGGGGNVQATSGGYPGGFVSSTSVYGYLGAQEATFGQTGNDGVANSGYGGDGGRSNTHMLDKKHRTTGWGGYGREDDADGVDFEGDVDPEELESSSDSCESSSDTHGLALGGAGGAAAGRVDAWCRNGASVAFPTLEICDCVEITVAADGKCACRLKLNKDGTAPKGYVPGTGGAGPSGGSGMFRQIHNDTYSKSGKGGNGVRGNNGAVYILINDIDGNVLSVKPLPIAQVADE